MHGRARKRDRDKYTQPTLSILSPFLAFYFCTPPNLKKPHQCTFTTMLLIDARTCRRPTSYFRALGYIFTKGCTRFINQLLPISFSCQIKMPTDGRALYHFHIVQVHSCIYSNGLVEKLKGMYMYL